MISPRQVTGSRKQICKQSFCSQAAPQGVNNKLAMSGESIRLLWRTAGMDNDRRSVSGVLCSPNGGESGNRSAQPENRQDTVGEGEEGKHSGLLTLCMI